MIAAYTPLAPLTKFLSGFFKSPPENFHSSEEVAVDILRGDESISVVIEDLSAGYRMNSSDKYTSKRFVPPIHKEAVPISAFDLMQRMPGENPFDSPDFRANAITRIYGSASKIEAKIRRAIELQAAQILQTGVLTLRDKNENALYSLDYGPKDSHFPTVSTSWASSTGANKIDNIGALSDVIRNNGGMDPDQIIMGSVAFEQFVSDSDVRARMDSRRLDLGTISPMVMKGSGGNYRGVVEIGNYRFDLWTYGGRYTNPVGSALTQYIDPNKVIVRASGGRLDATFGAIPNLGKLMGSGATNLLPELPGRMSNEEGGMDLHVNAWLTADGEQLFCGVGSRPLLIPTAIDTFGCLTTA
jgi:uncharacterized membrane protein